MKKNQLNTGASSNPHRVCMVHKEVHLQIDESRIYIIYIYIYIYIYKYIYIYIYIYIYTYIYIYIYISHV